MNRHTDTQYVKKVIELRICLWICFLRNVFLKLLELYLCFMILNGELYISDYDVLYWL